MKHEVCRVCGDALLPSEETHCQYCQEEIGGKSHCVAAWCVVIPVMAVLVGAVVLVIARVTQ